jgi:hypothetical protein
MFVIVAVVFNCLIICIFIASKKENEKLRKIFGAAWVSTVVPVIVTFAFYLLWGRAVNVILYMVLILSYYAAEILLDYVFKYDFRTNWKTHVPYIILEYAALFSFMFVTFSIDYIRGWVVAITFWGVMGAVIYLYAGEKKKETQL